MPASNSQVSTQHFKRDKTLERICEALFWPRLSTGSHLATYAAVPLKSPGGREPLVGLRISIGGDSVARRGESRGKL
jgi:hypothetical protein